MSIAHKPSNKKFQRRRNFLSRSAAVGGMAILGASAGPVQAAKSLTSNSLSVSPKNKAIWVGNATVKDFADLTGQRFRLRMEDGTTVHARLIETNAPTVRRALRFRREHFSLILDVPGNIELVQGQYRLIHPQIGSMDLFMVPVDLPTKHNRLEAIFA